MKQWTRHCVSTSFFPPFSKKMLSKRRDPAKAKKGAVSMTEAISRGQKILWKSLLVREMLVECDWALVDSDGRSVNWWSTQWIVSIPRILTVSFRLIQVITYSVTKVLIFVLVYTDWCAPFVFSPPQCKKMDTAM